MYIIIFLLSLIASFYGVYISKLLGLEALILPIVIAVAVTTIYALIKFRLDTPENTYDYYSKETKEAQKKRVNEEVEKLINKD